MCFLVDMCIVNPRRMRDEDYGSQLWCLCVCVCVCYHETSHTVSQNIETSVPT